MKLTYFQWGYSHDNAIIQAFKEAGLAVDTVKLPLAFMHAEEAGEEEPSKTGADGWTDAFRALAGDVVFSVNFFAVISDFCQKEAVPYCSWVLQLPDFDLYTPAVQNICNYIGLCDSYLVEKLWETGVEKAYFLPDAVELGGLYGENVEKGICFIGRHSNMALNMEGMSQYGEGYLVAFLHAQRVLYGASILEKGLIQRVWEEFTFCNPVPVEILPEFRRLYVADRYLAPVCTGLQQNLLLKYQDDLLTIYSDGTFPYCAAPKLPYVEEEEERRRIYASKEFSLVLAPHTLHNGIPRDVLEVIAAGGFLICGFQRDYAYFFQKDKNLVYFENPKEFGAAIVKYGNAPEIRERVRAAAYQEVAERHTYRQRVAAMLEMWGKL